MRTAIYPGSFDPITNGHLDVIRRGRRIFDRVVVAVAQNFSKTATFSNEERVQLIEENTTEMENVDVLAFDGLIIELAQQTGAVALIRGLRAVSDFEHEFQMAQMNRHLDDRIETVFLVPNEEYFFTSSALLKQVHQFTYRDTGLVPANVHRALCDKFGHP
ncbi:MAG: pantetheine-phosphate adenylyltransferase [Coraliomargaritaceae bacterium]